MNAAKDALHTEAAKVPVPWLRGLFRRGEFWVAATLLCLCLLIIVPIYQPMTFIYGDGPYYAWATISLIKDHDLDLQNQVPGMIQQHHLQLAQGKNGEWFIKHPILLSVLMVPFYMLFGNDGFLIANVGIILMWGIVLYRLALFAVPPFLAYVAVLLVWVLTNFSSYVYNVNSDILSTLCSLLFILFMLKARPFSSGLAWGLALWAKQANVLWAPIVGLWLWNHRKTSVWLRLAAGAALPIAIILSLNAAMFGSPWTTGYDRMMSIANDGAITLHSHRDDFHQSLWVGMRKQLLDPKNGLESTAPLLLISLPGLIFLAPRNRWLTLIAIYGYAAFFIFFSRYEGWYQSHYGNRFLMTPMALSVLPTAVLLDKLKKLIS